MKKITIAALAALSLVSAKSPKLETAKDSISYVIGTDMAKNLKEIGPEVDFDIVLKTFEAAIDGKATEFTPEVRMGLMRQLQQSVTERMKREAEELAQKNLEAGKNFLAENAKKEGVTVTESGLQYEVITSAEGEKPTGSDKVSVEYKGTLIDGTVFDETKGKPVTFQLNGVIKGWTEGLQLMSVGSKFRFVIPSDLAYGERGSRGAIGPNAVLVFEVTLTGIEKAAMKPQSKAKPSCGDHGNCGHSKKEKSWTNQ